MEQYNLYKERISGDSFKEFMGGFLHESVSKPAHFDIFFMLLTQEEDETTVWRASYICQKILKQSPHLLYGKEQALIALALRQSHSGTKRILLSILLEANIGKPVPVELLNLCFDLMFSPGEAIAVQALAVKIAYKLCCLEPELLPELKCHLQHAAQEYLSPAVRSSVRNVLKKLK